MRKKLWIFISALAISAAFMIASQRAEERNSLVSADIIELRPNALLSRR